MTSLSDDESSDGSYASYVQKKTKKVNLDEDDKKFFTSLPTCCMPCFLPLIPGMFQKVIALLQSIMKVGKNEFIGANSFSVYMS
jgi:hypothetical protein